MFVFLEKIIVRSLLTEKSIAEEFDIDSSIDISLIIDPSENCMKQQIILSLSGFDRCKQNIKKSINIVVMYNIKSSHFVVVQLLEYRHKDVY